MDTRSASLRPCARTICSTVVSEHKKPLAKTFHCFFAVGFNQVSNKQSIGRWNVTNKCLCDIPCVKSQCIWPSNIQSPRNPYTHGWHAISFVYMDLRIHKFTVLYPNNKSWTPGILSICKILSWRHNGRDSVSNHQPRYCLLSRLFRRRAKKTPKLRVTDLCEGNSPVTDGFPAQRASDAENFPFDDVITSALQFRNRQGDHTFVSSPFYLFREAFLSITFVV